MYLFSILLVACLAVHNALSNASNEPIGECIIHPSKRHDCGYFGIKEDECSERGCCWAESSETETPWCYHSKASMSPSCMVSGEVRTDCGYHGIKKAECMAKICCWQPSNEAGVPWCFDRKGEVKCGVPTISPNVHSSNRIVGGVKARPHSWPWQISMSILNKTTSIRQHSCGASVISKDWIVTAAHCLLALLVDSNPHFTLGIHRLDEQNNLMQVVEAENWIPHPKFDLTFNSSIDYDIMLIKTKVPIVFNDYVSPVCLPRQNQEIEAGTKCYASGWGYLRENKKTPPNDLQQVMLPIVDQKRCQEWYTNVLVEDDDGSFVNITLPVTDGMICAGYEEGKKGICNGDSGGPLVCYTEGRWTLVGASSFSNGCARRKGPSVFAKISAFINWIQETMKKES